MHHLSTQILLFTVESSLAPTHYHIRPYYKYKSRLKARTCYFLHHFHTINNIFFLIFFTCFFDDLKKTGSFKSILCFAPMRKCHIGSNMAVKDLVFVFSHPCQNVFFFSGKHKLKGTQTHFIPRRSDLTANHNDTAESVARVQQIPTLST